MEYKKNDVIELNITDIGTAGEGIGRMTKDGIPFFVKGTVTGDRIEAGVLKMKSSYGYARLIRIIEPSPWRVESRCPIAGKCGGCVLQHMDYTKQAEYKQQIVKNCLERIGGLTDVPYEPVVSMENPWYYRNKAQFPVSRDKNGRVCIGFYAGHTHSVIDTDHCYIQAKVMQPVLNTIRKFLEDYNIPVYEEATGKGLVRHILMRVGFETGEVMVCPVLNGKKLPEANILEEKIRRTIEEYNQNQGAEEILKYDLTSFCININTEKTNVILGDKVSVISGRSYIRDKIGEVTYRISPLSFYQVNPVQTKVIYDTVKEFAALTGNETLWDLYCGTGTISLYLAKEAKQVIGVEIVPQAIEDARENARANGIGNAQFHAGAAEKLFPKLMESAPVDVAVVDPPRKGCDEKLIQALLEMKPKRLVYVSCDPATLARDLKLLTKDCYKIAAVRPVDAFCHSVHVETVCLLLRTDVES